MSALATAAAEAAAAADFGTPSARKSGRNPKWPYVAVIKYSNRDGHEYTTTLRGLAFATRDEAVARAQREIDAHRRTLERKLQEPRYRALREHHGLPREIEEFST